MRGAGGADRLDRLVDRGVVGRRIAEEELVEAEPEGGQHRRVEPPRRPLGEDRDRGVGGPPPLDRAIGEPLCLGALPAGEAGGVGRLAERPLRECAVLERLAHDREGDRARLR